MTLSICIPTYKSLDLIDATLQTVLAQTYKDFEVIICNDSPNDHEQLKEKLDKYNDPRIRFYANETNLGYPLNIKKCVDKSKFETVFLLGQDDLILGRSHFERVVSILKRYPEVGVITRAYYWFDDDPYQPIRHIPIHKRRVMGCDDRIEDLHAIFSSVGQLSGLVYRKKLINHPFNKEIFPAHIYPFLSVLRTHKCYFWPEYSIAVRTSSSQTRFLSSIYKPSPTKTWVEMFQNVFPEARYCHIRQIGIDFITQNYVGLAQLKNYGYFADLMTDVYYMAKYRKTNLLSPKFWFFTCGAILTPRFLLRPLVDSYKKVVIKKNLAQRGLIAANAKVAGQPPP